MGTRIYEEIRNVNETFRRKESFSAKQGPRTEKRRLFSLTFLFVSACGCRTAAPRTIPAGSARGTLARQTSNSYRVHWDGRDHRGEGVANGVYLYRLQAGTVTQGRKMLVLE